MVEPKFYWVVFMHTLFEELKYGMMRDMHEKIVTAATFSRKCIRRNAHDNMERSSSKLTKHQ